MDCPNALHRALALLDSAVIAADVADGATWPGAIAVEALAQPPDVQARVVALFYDGGYCNAYALENPEAALLALLIQSEPGLDDLLTPAA